MNVKLLRGQAEHSPYIACVNWDWISTSKASCVCTAWCLIQALGQLNVNIYTHEEI